MKKDSKGASVYDLFQIVNGSPFHLMPDFPLAFNILIRQES